MSVDGDFWARRKAGVAAEVEEDLRVEARAEQALAEQVSAEKSDAEILAELQLPDPDDLKAGDDFSVFLAKAVPERLRRRALRKLWLSNPVLANVDQLVDYGEDFTDSAMVLENMQTAYQVGKGMTQHIEEMARQAQAEADESSGVDEAEAAPEDMPPAALAEDDASENGSLAAEAETEVRMAHADIPSETHNTVSAPVEHPTDEMTQDAPVVRRRLRFEFSAEAPAQKPFLQETRPT